MPRREAVKGGVVAPGVGKVAGDLRTLLEDLTRRVIDGELETSRGAVANQLIGTRIRLLEYERRIREEELLARIEQLEQSQEQKGGKRWGA